MSLRTTTLTLARRDATEPAPRLEAPPFRASARASRQANVNQRRSKVKRMVIVVVIALAWIGAGWTWDDRGAAHAATFRQAT